MASVIFVQNMAQLRAGLSRIATEAPARAMQNVVNTDGKALYNYLNNNTNVDTGRLKRGNIMEITPFGFHYWNNVPYAAIVNRKYKPHFMDMAFNRFKPNALRRVNDEVGKEIQLLFKSLG